MNKKEAIKHGLYEYYYEDEYSDQIKWRGYYKNGVKHGLIEAFHWKNGYLVRKEHWREGQEEGLWEQFDQETFPIEISKVEIIEDSHSAISRGCLSEAQIIEEEASEASGPKTSEADQNRTDEA